MTKKFIVIACITLVMAQAIQASWKTIEQRNTTRDGLLSYADLTDVSSTYTKTKGYNECEIFTCEVNIRSDDTGKPVRWQHVYTFDKNKNLVEFFHQEFVFGTTIINKQASDSAHKADTKKVSVNSKTAEKVAGQKSGSQSAAASATEAPKPETPKLTVNTGSGKAAPAIETTPENTNNGKIDNASKPRRMRSFIRSYYKHALAGLGILGIIWKIRSDINKRKIEREKSARA